MGPTVLSGLPCGSGFTHAYTPTPGLLGSFKWKVRGHAASCQRGAGARVAPRPVPALPTAPIEPNLHPYLKLTLVPLHAPWTEYISSAAPLTCVTFAFACLNALLLCGTLCLTTYAAHVPKPLLPPRRRLCPPA